jgi:putative flippase GtrA
MDVMLTKIISIVIVALVQFLINRVFAFGDR